MGPDHLLDARWDDAMRLRAGGTYVALGGWWLAAATVFTMALLPSGSVPMLRTLAIAGMIVVWALGLALWSQGWWRLTNTRLESLVPTPVVLLALGVRFGLIASLLGSALWLGRAAMRSMGHAPDPTFADTLMGSAAPLSVTLTLPPLVLALLCAQGVLWSLARRTAPSRVDLHLRPFLIATLPVGLVTVPSAMSQPSFSAFASTGVAILFAFTGTQGLMLRHRIGRVLRERRRAEVLASRAEATGTLA